MNESGGEGVITRLQEMFFTRRKFLEKSASAAAAVVLSPKSKPEGRSGFQESAGAEEKKDLRAVGEAILTVEVKKMRPFENELWGVDGLIAPIELKVHKLSSGEFAAATMKRLPELATQPGIEPVIFDQHVYRKGDNGQLAEVSDRSMVKPEVVYLKKGKEPLAAEVVARAVEVTQKEGDLMVRWDYEGKDGQPVKVVRVAGVGVGIDAAHAIRGEVSLVESGRRVKTDIVKQDAAGGMVAADEEGLVVGAGLNNLVLPLGMEKQIGTWRDAEYSHLKVLGVLPGMEVLVPGKTDESGKVVYEMKQAKTVPALDVLNQNLGVPGAVYMVGMRGFWSDDNTSLLFTGDSSVQILLDDEKTVKIIDEWADKGNVAVQMTREIATSSNGVVETVYTLHPEQMVPVQMTAEDKLREGLVPVKMINPGVVVRFQDNSVPISGQPDLRDRSRQAGR